MSSIYKALQQFFIFVVQYNQMAELLTFKKRKDKKKYFIRAPDSSLVSFCLMV